MKIFRARTLVTSNASHDVFEDAFLAIDKDKILDLGPWKKRPRSRSAQTFDWSHGIVTPGLFNLHTHLPMVLLRGIAEDVELSEWLYKTIFPLEKRWVSEDFCRIGTELALCESIRNGVTYIAEMYFYEDVIADCLDRFGLRGMLGATVWDIEAPNFKTFDDGMELVDDLVKEYRHHPRLQPAIAPHAPYTCSPKSLREVAAYAKSAKIPAMIHLAEAKWEVDDCLKKYKTTPFQHIHETGLMEAPLLLMAHAIWIQETEFEFLKKPSLSVVLNPQCNAKLASGIPPAQKYLEKGVRFTLGTDGAASNNGMDILSEMNFLSKIHHVSTQDLKGLPQQKIFDAATQTSAEAVGLGHQLGSLEPGKQADFICLNSNIPHLTPLTQVYSHLIHSARGSDVESVFVAGRCLMKNRKILVADETKILSRANKLYRQMARGLKTLTS